MRRTSVTLIVLLALSASLLPNGAAHAAKRVARDATGDVLVYNTETDEESSSSTANGDIKKAVIRHTSRAVVAKVKFRALKRKGDYRVDFIRLVTNDRVKRNVTLVAGQGFWSGQAVMEKPNGKPVDCNVKHRINYGKNLVKVKVPRSCLSKPRWVRVGVGAFWGEGSLIYGDDALRNGRIGNRFKLSGRVRRG